MTEQSVDQLCPWCSSTPRRRHARWCPCSAAMRREIRDAYRVSDYEGMRIANKIRAEAEIRQETRT